MINCRHMRTRFLVLFALGTAILAGTACSGADDDCREVIAHPYDAAEDCYDAGETEIVGCWPQDEGDNNANLCWFDEEKSRVIVEDYNVLSRRIENAGWSRCEGDEPRACSSDGL